MRAVYAASLIAGLAGLLWWLVVEARRGDRPSADLIRRVIAAGVTFGIAGLSASFAGVTAWLAAVLAVLAAAAMVVYSDRAVG